jgi:Uri superfamily endonuclease
VKSAFKNQAGTYALILSLPTPCGLEAGALGLLSLERGFYIYVGSAFGPGGLRARLAHHLSVASRPHWHIDYLRQAAAPVEVWTSCDPLPQEHAWAMALSAAPAYHPIPHFWASGCRCGSHLFYAPRLPCPDHFSGLLPSSLPVERVALQPRRDLSPAALH